MDALSFLYFIEMALESDCAPLWEDVSRILDAGVRPHFEPVGLKDPEDRGAGRHPGRSGETEWTLFKSVGVAVQDVAAAELALANAREQGLGSAIEL